MGKVIYDPILNKLRWEEGGAGLTAQQLADFELLKDNEFKIIYYEEVSTTSGTVTIPSGATILLDEFASGVDAVCESISGGKPTGNASETSGGVIVQVTSFDSSGNFVLSGTPASYPVALVYILKIKAVDYSSLDLDRILEWEKVNPLTINETAAIKNASNPSSGNPFLTSAYVGSANISTVGTITSGVWNGSVIPVLYGGTGTNNGSITGTSALTFTAGGTNQNINLIASGTGKVTTNISGLHLFFSGSFRSSFESAGGDTYITSSTNLIYRIGGGTEVVRTTSVGTGFGIVANPLAIIELKAGSTTVAPIRLRSGTNKTTAAAGEIEYNGKSFFATEVLTRRAISLSNDVVVSSVTVANTTTETIVHTSTLSANSLDIKKILRINLRGSYSTKNASDTFTLRVRAGGIGGTIISTATSVAANVTDAPCRLQSMTTVKTVGAGGTMSSYMNVDMNNISKDSYTSSTGVDTTTSNDFIVTVEWSSADVLNTLTIDQGFLEMLGGNV